MYLNNLDKYKIIWISYGYSCVPKLIAEYGEFYNVEEVVELVVSVIGNSLFESTGKCGIL